jgi:hypothetical protein
MLATVKFNDEFLFYGNKINNVIANRVLSSKTYPVEFVAM